MVFLTGISGSGKSVLLRLAMGLLKPDAGQIFIDGREIETLEESELRTNPGSTEIQNENRTNTQRRADHLFSTLLVESRKGRELRLKCLAQTLATRLRSAICTSPVSPRSWRINWTALTR